VPFSTVNGHNPLTPEPEALMLRLMCVRVLVAVLAGATLAACQAHSQDVEPLSRTDYKPPPVAGERCPTGSPHASATADVLLSDRQPQPTVTVAPGQSVTVRVSSDADVTEPQASNPGVACRLSVTLSGHSGTATFLARSAGSTYVGATVTGIAGGLNHPAYGATIVVK
jgi:hypothetical protein